MAEYKITYAAVPVFPEKADYSIDIVLQEVLYKMRLAWNATAGAWFVSLYDADGTPRIEGRKLIKEWPLCSNIPQAAPQYGMLQAYGDVDVPYSQADLGTLLNLFFVTLERTDV